MPSHTQHSFNSSASRLHAKRISCTITENWKLQSVVSPPLENVAIPLYHKLSVALNFLLTSFSHALSQHPVARTKNFLSRTRPAPNTTPTIFPNVVAANIWVSNEQQYLVWETASRSTKRHDMLETFWGARPPWSLLALCLRRHWRKNSKNIWERCSYYQQTWKNIR